MFPRLAFVFVFEGVDIGVEVAIGVAFVITAVFEFALRVFAFTFTFVAVSPHDERTNVPAATVSKYPAIFFISVSSKIYPKIKGRLRCLRSFDINCLAAKSTARASWHFDRARPGPCQSAILDLPGCKQCIRADTGSGVSDLFLILSICQIPDWRRSF